MYTKKEYNIKHKEIHYVVISKRAEKDLSKVPRHISMKLQEWAADIEDRGLAKVRVIPGYHDEPLKGKRKGERSIRLNKAYRAFYTTKASVRANRKITIIMVNILEVNRHEYKK